LNKDRKFLIHSRLFFDSKDDTRFLATLSNGHLWKGATLNLLFIGLAQIFDISKLLNKKKLPASKCQALDMELSL